MEFDNPTFEEKAFDDPKFEDEYIDDDPFVTDPLPDDARARGATTDRPLSLQQELLQSAVDDYYNELARRGLTPAVGRDHGKFELVAGKLRLKAYPNIDLTNVQTGEPLAFSTLAGQREGH
jgi:hypothetical protein